MITHAELLKRVSYDKDAGIFVWRNGPREGREVGRLVPAHGRSAAEWRLKFNGRTYGRGRVAWFYMTGVWPVEIDHKDGVRLNDRWDNLREADRIKNEANKGCYRNSKSRLKGVYLTHGRWAASIQVNWNRKFLGCFDSKEEAAEAYRLAAVAAHGEYSRAA